MRIILFCLLLSACVSTKKQMNSWLGQDERDLVATWGLPDKTDSYGGRKVLIYAKPVYAGDYGTTWQYSSFFVDRNGTIQSWTVRQTTVPIESLNVRILY